MKSYEELIEEHAINEDKIITNGYVVGVYKEQLEKFKKLGIGGQTENGVFVTQSLIDITEKRLRELKPLLRARSVEKACKHCGEKDSQ